MQGVCFSSVVFINLEAFIANRLVDTCCTEEGFLVPEFHQPPLLCQDAWPRLRHVLLAVGPDVSLRHLRLRRVPVLNKKDKATGEGVMRGDQACATSSTSAGGTTSSAASA